MGSKGLFTVPAGEKISEKQLAKVLISSVCSILLCVGCLVSATWAWFTVSIGNEDNVIQIAEPKILVNDGDFQSGSVLPGDEVQIRMENANLPDDFNRKSTLYVTLTVDGAVAGYLELNLENGYGAKVVITGYQGVVLSWDVSWFPPASTGELSGGRIFRVEGATEASVETTQETLAEDET